MSAAGPVARTPQFPEIGVLALPNHSFNPRWRAAHHVLTRLASYFNVVWLEPAHHWRDRKRPAMRRAEVAKLLPACPPGFDVVVPDVWLPDMHGVAPLRRALMRERVRCGYRRLRANGASRFVLDVWHYRFEPALDVHPRSLSLYHIDDDYAFVPDEAPTAVAELRMLGRADQVVVTSERLLERKGTVNPNTALIPIGVDYALYSSTHDEPADMAHIPHPRVGYTGFLKPQLDWPLLKTLAMRHPGISFVFVGPVSPDDRAKAAVDDMRSLPNVYFAGSKAAWELAAYVASFDVCIMPYLLNGYTDNIYPMKMHEFLAAGLPVIGSPIRTVRAFGDVVSLASTADEWSDALIRGLETASMQPAMVAARRRVARANDWSELTFRTALMICERIDPALVTRLVKHTAGTIRPA